LKEILGILAHLQIVEVVRNAALASIVPLISALDVLVVATTGKQVGALVVQNLGECEEAFQVAEKLI